MPFLLPVDEPNKDKERDKPHIDPSYTKSDSYKDKERRNRN